MFLSSGLWFWRKQFKHTYFSPTIPFPVAFSRRVVGVQLPVSHTCPADMVSRPSRLNWDSLNPVSIMVFYGIPSTVLGFSRLNGMTIASSWSAYYQCWRVSRSCCPTGLSGYIGVFVAPVVCHDKFREIIFETCLSHTKLMLSLVWIINSHYNFTQRRPGLT